MLQGQPRDHTEYVIYDKRRALIKYVVFYSTPSAREGNVQGARLVGETDSRSGSSSPVSGSSSPTSGRSTPHSDVGTDDVVPVTYESVKRVNAVRPRPQPLTTRSGMLWNNCLQCFNAAGWASGRASHTHAHNCFTALCPGLPG